MVGVDYARQFTLMEIRLQNKVWNRAPSFVIDWLVDPLCRRTEGYVSLFAVVTSDDDEITPFSLPSF